MNTKAIAEQVTAIVNNCNKAYVTFDYIEEQLGFTM